MEWVYQLRKIGKRHYLPSPGYSIVEFLVLPNNGDFSRAVLDAGTEAGLNILESIRFWKQYDGGAHIAKHSSEILDYADALYPIKEDEQFLKLFQRHIIYGIGAALYEHVCHSALSTRNLQELKGRTHFDILSALYLFLMSQCGTERVEARQRALERIEVGNQDALSLSEMAGIFCDHALRLGYLSIRVSIEASDACEGCQTLLAQNSFGMKGLFW